MSSQDYSLPPRLHPVSTYLYAWLNDSNAWFRYCEWGYCRESFRRREDLLQHIKKHIAQAKPVKRSWLDSQASQSYLPPRFENVAVVGSPDKRTRLEEAHSPVASTSALPQQPVEPSSNETTEESQSQSQSSYPSVPKPATLADESFHDTSDELPAPILSAPPPTIPTVPLAESQHSEYTQDMSIQETMDAPSPVPVNKPLQEDDEDDDDDVPNSSFVVEEELLGRSSTRVTPSSKAAESFGGALASEGGDMSDDGLGQEQDGAFAMHFSQLAGQQMTQV